VRPATTALALLASCSPPTTGGSGSPAHDERLAPATGTYRQIDHTAVFELPDSGGFLVNTAAVDSLQVESLLGALFRDRPSERRAVFVWDNPRRRSAVHWIRQAAERAGGQAFDAALSGWPRQMPGPPP
jgi:hypothetical protein